MTAQARQLEFQQFFREQSEHWLERFDYKEVGPQLLLQAFLHRIVNGGGRIEREYGRGRGRTDLFVIWPYSIGVQRVVLERKVQRKALDKTITEGLAQTYEYGERCNADELHFVVFGRTKKTGQRRFSTGRACIKVLRSRCGAGEVKVTTLPRGIGL